MRYVLLVSHGTLAPSLQNATRMLIGEQGNLRSASMPDGTGADEYVESFRALLTDLLPTDQIVLLADLAEGSPMTNALNTLSECGLLANTVAIAGMNLPAVLTAAMLEEEMPNDEVSSAILVEAHNQLRAVTLELGADQDI